MLTHNAKPGHGEQLLSFLQDASRFALRNRSIIDEAPMQIYLSALLFAPSDSYTRRIFGPGLQKYFDLIPRVRDQWGAETQKLEGHQHTVRAIAFMPDGNAVVSSADDETVRIWDAATGEEKQKFCHWQMSNPMVVSPDGNTIAVGSASHTVILWDVATGEQRRTLEGHGARISVLAFSPDNKSLVSGSEDNTVVVWDVATGAKKEKHHYDVQISAIIFSPAGTTVASQSSRTISHWDITNGEKRLEFEQDSDIRVIAVAPAGDVIAIALHDNTIRLLNTATGEEMQKLQGPDKPCSAIALSSDGKMLACGFWNGATMVWDIDTGRKSHILEGHTEDVYALTFAPDSSVLASGSRDMTIRLWDMESDAETHKSEGHDDSVCAIALSPDGELAASGSKDGTVRLWQVATGMEMLHFEVGEFDVPIDVIAFTQDAKSAVAFHCLSQKVLLWDTTTGAVKRKQRLEGFIIEAHAIALSPDGATVVIASHKWVVRAHDMRTGKIIWTHQAPRGVRKIAFSEDGSRLETDMGQLDPSTGFSKVLQPPRFALSMGRYADYSWIKYCGADFLWLPHEYRGDFHDTSASIIAIGHASGAVSIMSVR